MRGYSEFAAFLMRERHSTEKPMTANDRPGESLESVHLADEAPNRVPRVRGTVRNTGTVLMRFHREESGASLVEYALLIGLIAAVAATVVQRIGTIVVDMLNGVSF